MAVLYRSASGSRYSRSAVRPPRASGGTVVTSQVLALHARGITIAAISREVGVSRKTITRWLAVDGFPERHAASPRVTTLAPHADYLHKRWDEGCHTVTQLWRELRESRGFRGGLSTVRGWIYTHLRSHAPASTIMTSPNEQTSGAHPFRPSLRRTAWLLTAPAERLKAPEQVYVDAACAACPEIATAHTLAADFRHMLREKDCNALSPYGSPCGSPPQSKASYARWQWGSGATATPCLPPSSSAGAMGQVEGQVNRLKLLKRTMYGRASFALLRRRVLAA